MSPENSNPQLNLVTFHHEAEVCPVKQDTPDAAASLSGSLTEAREAVGKIPGAFLPPDHRGAALASGDPETVLALFKDVLSNPPHTVEVHPLELADEQLKAIAADPGLLEGDSEGAVANRTLLFEKAHELVPDNGYDQSIEGKTPSLSLVELEDYLKGKAEEISQHAHS